MLESAFLLLMKGLLLMLRIAPGDSFPRPLSREEEEACLARLAEGDLEARNTLVEHNLRLVAHILKKYYAQTDDMDDLLSIGTIGLIKGVDSFKPEKNIRLATYCSRCIENEVLMHFRSQRRRGGELSLSEELDAEGEGGGLALQDMLAQEDDLAERIGSEEIAAALRRCVETELGERERLVIRLRYGLGGEPPLTQRETAQRCRISRSYVSRIEKRALAKLRAALGEEAAPD
ncbi:MAG: RNA polymerase sporulation sigma factor SigK [Oscillospiraceae bacterium]|nr:RNA polymerase sporulation sigma factor SigK [Oscillospiraceae bacterium]